jgi:hypothetical protein
MKLKNKAAICALSGRLKVESDGAACMGKGIFFLNKAYQAPNNARQSATVLDNSRLMEVSPPGHGDVGKYYDNVGCT